MPARPKAFNRFFFMSLIPYALIIIMAIWVQKNWPGDYSRILGDDAYWGKESLREWICLGILFFVVALSAFFYFKGKPRNTLLLIIAIWTFLVAMEECDWTQQIFHFPTPEFFLAKNAKGAVNFHNFWMPWGLFVDLIFGLPLIYFIGKAFVRFLATADGIGADILMWIALVFFTEVFVSHENSGTLLQFAMYTFMVFLVLLLNAHQQGKLPTAPEKPIYKILLSSEQRKANQ